MSANTLLSKEKDFNIVFKALYGEGSGTPLQYSCLENPMDGAAWWAAVHGVSKSWTRLKRLSSSSSIQTSPPSGVSLPPVNPHPTP